jgi:nucleoside-diphosphate-sugar epimerase
MRLLLTGAAGFLGSRLALELKRRDHEVFCVDRSEGDLRLPACATEIVQDHEADVVVHLAANPGRVFGEQDPADTIANNVIATINVAKACANAGSALCYVSTSEVYGTACDHQRHPVDETTVLGEPRNLYGASKFWGEQVAEMYAPTNLQIIRPTMPYGPGMATGVGRAALPTMIQRFLNDEPYVVHERTARSWCYVDDLVSGMADVVERGIGVYNVGRDDDLRYMVDVAHLVCDVIGANHDLVQVGEHDESITRVKNISTAKLRGLGWLPLVDLEEGIRLTAQSMKSKQ